MNADWCSPGPKSSIELRHLRSFVVTAEELHFTRAAVRLHLRQQGLSAQIHHLERELGVALFKRTTRSVALTDAGQAFRKKATQILADVDEAVALARRVAPSHPEVVTISYTPTVSGDVLQSVLERTHAALPHLRIGLCETWTPDTVRGVVEGRFDIAIARCPPPADGVTAVEIRREPLGAVLAANHPLAAHGHVPLGALDDLALTIWDRRLSPTFFDEVMRAFPTHADAAHHFEMEQFGPETFYGDPVSRREILAGRAFYVTCEGHYATLPCGFVWRAVRPAYLVGCMASYRTDDSRLAVREIVAAARSLAVERGWLEAPSEVVS